MTVAVTLTELNTGSRDAFVKPLRKSTFGVPASNAQASTVPSGFFTSR